MKSSTLLACVAVPLMGMACAVQAQCEPGWLPGDCQPGMTSGGAVVHDTVELPNGDLVAAGWFTAAGGVPASNIARWDHELKNWLPLGAGLNATPSSQLSKNVYALQLMPDGDIIAGGHFNLAGGQEANRIARWDADTQTWSKIGGGFNGFVTDLAILANGEIAAVGTIGAARWNGQNWISAPALNGTSLAIATMPDGTALVGGEFTASGATPLSHLAQWDPVTTSWSAFGPGGNGSVYDIVVLPDGDVLIGGDFTSMGGIQASMVARWDAQTGNWSSFGGQIYERVISVTAMPNGDIVAGGSFTLNGNLNQHHIARWSAASQQWLPLSLGFETLVRHVSVNSAGELIAGGYFASPTAAIAKFDGTAQKWTSFGNGLNQSVYAMAELPSGDILAGGAFTKAGATGMSHIGIRSKQTGKWSAFGGIGYDPKYGGSVAAVDVAADGDIYVGGFFFGYGVGATNNIQRWDSTTQEWSNLQGGVKQPGNFGAVNALLPLPNNDVIVGGNFYTAGPIDARYIARWNENTGWSSMPGLNGNTQNYVGSLALLPNGDIVAGGNFNATSPASIARWDSQTQTWSPLGIVGNGSLVCIATRPNGDILAGGTFTTMNGEPMSTITILDAQSGAWLPLGLGLTGAQSTNASAMTLLPDGTLAVGGTFTTAGSTPALNIARWNFDTHVWSAFGSGVYGPTPTSGGVSSLLALSDGTLAVGGSFTIAGDHPSARFALWGCDNACYPDCDGDAQLTIDDFICFQTLFALGDPQADCDASGSLDIDDFICFQTTFAIGC